ncbi:MAG: hypothetical protein A4E50_00011 [Methanosaeta sp. PtaB.Bin087]|nr:MAG: hypothetical protein A4E50_00011 [Methanosaeta sp. PtaB.Bin087]
MAIGLLCSAAAAHPPGDGDPRHSIKPPDRTSPSYDWLSPWDSYNSPYYSSYNSYTYYPYGYYYPSGYYYNYYYPSSYYYTYSYPYSYYYPYYRYPTGYYYRTRYSLVMG